MAFQKVLDLMSGGGGGGETFFVVIVHSLEFNSTIGTWKGCFDIETINPQSALTYIGQPSPVETVKSVRKAHRTLS